jgi:hypothetical protein
VLAKAAKLPKDPSNIALYASNGFAPLAIISPAETSKAKKIANTGLAYGITKPPKPVNLVDLGAFT